MSAIALLMLVDIVYGGILEVSPILIQHLQTGNDRPPLT